MLWQSLISWRSKAREAEVMACCCMKKGISVSERAALPSNMVLCGREEGNVVG